MVVIFNIVVFWVLTPFSLVGKCHPFGQTCCLHCWSCKFEFMFAADIICCLKLLLIVYKVILSIV